jgi:hypothetical protein
MGVGGAAKEGAKGMRDGMKFLTFGPGIFKKFGSRSIFKK